MIIATSSPNKWKIGAALIKWFQKTEFSHVLIIHEDLVYQASHGFVNCMHISNFLENNTIFNQYNVPDSAVDMNFVKLQLGKPYGYYQLINIVTKIYKIKLFKSDKNQRFICSEYVGKALMLDWANDNTTPVEISDYLKKTYGNIN